MKVFFEPNDARYIVFRRGERMPLEEFPPGLEGRWEERPDFLGLSASVWERPHGSAASAFPTNRFEVREDGEIAQVFEVRWPSRVASHSGS